jgi:phosphohistidine phosphatase SixA
LSDERPTSLHLVRHTDAGDRDLFVGEDLTRPLSKKGRRQAIAVAERLFPARLARLVSSPAVRCVESLEPLAKSSGLSLEEADELVEGSDPVAALEFMLGLSPSSGAQLVACSHGDIITGIVETLLAGGVASEGRPRLEKGATTEFVLSPTGRPVLLRFVKAP